MRKELLGRHRKGSVIELAIAIVIANYAASALGTIMNDLVLPLLGFVDGGKSLSSLFINLAPDKLTPQGGPVDSLEKARYVGAPVIAYGACLEVLLQLVLTVLLAWAILAWLRRIQNAGQVKISMPVPVASDKKLPAESAVMQ